jgi:hypothetical protein
LIKQDAVGMNVTKRDKRDEKGEDPCGDVHLPPCGIPDMRDETIS